MEKKRLKEIFSKPYNAEDWQQILIDIFGANILRKEHEPLTNGNDNVEGFELGVLTTKESDGRRYEIGLYEYEIKQKHRIELNRVGLRSLVKSFTRFKVDAALVVFYDKIQWRVSFICDLKEGEQTAPKRFTYLFGCPEETYKTAIDRFSLLTNNGSTFESIFDAFNVEKLSKAFFAGYKEQFRKFSEYLGGSEKWKRDYVKKLLGRLVFLQFLQKKGWMAAPANSQRWKDGDPNFLSNLIERHKGSNTILSDILKPLFFETLNEKRENDIANPKLGENIRIPYLNGGLFDDVDLDSEHDVEFPYSMFKELMDFFAIYNFTIDENDPDDSDVGIDPEMLGHIFENLLEDNKDKGTFYTPKEIVQYMSRESVVEYLKTHIPNELHSPIKRLVVNEIVDDVLQNKDNARLVNELLKNIKVCDPAIGSGAFPMGVLGVIFKSRRLLYGFLNKPQPFMPSIIKREIIQNNIYGVDIEQGAVDIARLRFWLSLVVDEEQPEPLPNLDFKIMQGNSLLESFNGIDLSDFNAHKSDLKDQLAMFGTLFETDSTQEQIDNLIGRYYSETDHARKENLLASIEHTVRGHIKKSAGNNPGIVAKVDALDHTNMPFFLWHVYFNEVFQKGGFDVVIGNPPYIAFQRMDEESKKALQRAKFKTYGNTGDIYAIFYERGRQLLKNKGVLIYITSRQWMQASYGKTLRKYLVSETNPIQLIDFGQLKIFDGATVFVNILMFEKSENQNILQGCLLPTDYDLAKNNLSDYFNQNHKILKNLSSETWSISDLQDINDRIEAKGKPINEWKGFSFFRGITSGLNEAFHISEAKKNELIATDPKNAEIIKPLLRGKDIKRYGYDYKKLHIINTHNGLRSPKIPRVDVVKDYPVIYDHLLQWQSELENRLDKGEHWTNLRNCAFLLEFEKPKIVWIEISDRANYTYDDKGLFLTNSAYFLTNDNPDVNLKYLLAILNSMVADFYFSQKTARIAGGRMRYTKQYVEQIPIPIIPIKQQQLFVILVDVILYLKQQKKMEDNDKIMSLFFEDVIDIAVAELYFKEEFEKENFSVINYLTDNVNLNELSITDIRKEFLNLHNPECIVQQAISGMYNIEPLKTIVETLKR